MLKKIIVFKKNRVLKKRTYFYFLFVLLLFSSTDLFAKHIIGGEITYVCLGDGNYIFTMKIFRDCSDITGADFDSKPLTPTTGTVSIYRGNEQNEFANIILNPPAVTSIQPNLSNPCLFAPPSVCVEQGVYTFQINLPVADVSYHIVYQRCCRNVTINNVVDPGDIGATYTMELTPLAQQVCNNSPTFNDFPPIVICAGEDINFDHSATDPDGDQLVYELCTPYEGGGPDGMIAPFSFTGVAPNPDAPPPFNNVTFSPPFSFDNPLGGNSPLSIDPNTGLITGVPQIQGQFVVCVSVKEFRNGELLSVDRREFQFNVAQCNPTVVADIQEDDLIIQNDNSKLFVVNACGDANVLFVNESFDQRFIDEFFWEFDINGTTQTFNTYDATVDFPGEGSYNGRLVLNPGRICADTANILVNIFPKIVADFTSAFDTCVAGPVQFTDLSFSDAGPGTIINRNWSFGDGNNSSQVNPSHQYMVAGSIPVTLEVTDTNSCATSETKIVPYFPAPALLVVAPSTVLGCQPVPVFFNNLSFPIDSTYDIVWDFGDGTFGSEVSPLHVYEDPGVFTVSLEVTSPIGCMIDTLFPDLITVLGSPTAGFSFSPQQPTNIEPTVQFTDESKNAVLWNWDFGGLGSSFAPSPVFTFPDTGRHEIRQIVTHQSGCMDTLIKVVDVIPEVRYFLPNAFTPNGDGDNDFYRGNGIMEGAQDFNFAIWNRYGEKLFETSDPFEGWNGRKNNSGQLMDNGVYIAVVSFKGPRGKRFELRSYATLIR